MDGLPAPDSRRAASVMSCGVRMPATTSSPWALTRNSPYRRLSPVEGLRVKATPVADVSPILPNTIACTLTAVPQDAGMAFNSRYFLARGIIHEPNTAPTAPQSWACGSCGKGEPCFSCTMAL